MGRKEITTKEDLMKVIELFENTGITYWLDGGWGVDILAGKQTRIHRDIDINFDAQHTEKLLNVLLNLGYKIDTDWKPVRIELYSDELGYLDIHPFVLNEDGTLDCQHFFRQIFLGYFSDIVQAFDTLRKNVCGDDYTSLHNPIVLSSVLPAYGMFHSIQILFL